MFVVETNKSVQIDVGYLNEILHHFYELDRSIVIKYVYMDGKFKYNQSNVRKEIQRYQRMYSGKTIVIYVFDKDEAALDIRDSDFISQVERFCKHHEYKLIWFVKNIEHVMHRKIITSKDKKRMLDQFKRKHLIETVHEQNLNSPNPCKAMTSNILHVLDVYLLQKMHR